MTTQMFIAISIPKGTKYTIIIIIINSTNVKFLQKIETNTNEQELWYHQYNLKK